jgi:hypothetical protein
LLPSYHLWPFLALSSQSMWLLPLSQLRTQSLSLGLSLLSCSISILRCHV